MKSKEEDDWNSMDNFGDITGDEDTQAPSPVKAMILTFLVLGIIIGLVIVGGEQNAI